MKALPKEKYRTNTGENREAYLSSQGRGQAPPLLGTTPPAYRVGAIPCGRLRRTMCPRRAWEGNFDHPYLDTYGAIPCGRSLGDCVALQATPSLQSGPGSLFRQRLDTRSAAARSSDPLQPSAVRIAGA